MKGITLRVQRVRRGLSQTELAKRIGLTQTEVSKLERGIFIASKETSVKIRRIFREIDENGKGNEERKV